MVVKWPSNQGFCSAIKWQELNDQEKAWEEEAERQFKAKQPEFMLQLINNNLTTKSTEKPVLNLEGKTDVQELPSKSDYETENKVGKLESLEEGCLPEEIIVSKKKGGRKKKGSSLQKFLEGIKN